MDVVGTLQRTVQRDATVLRHRDNAVRLDVQLLLMSGAVLALDDHVRLSQTLLEGPFVDGDRLEGQR